MNASFLWEHLYTMMGEHAPMPMPDAGKWNMIRQYRNELLTRCDWTQLPDVPLTLEEKQLWATYRQELRDLTEDFVTPDEVIFPAPPGEQQ